jgi:type I thyroxine 5'-deiodinase
MTIPCLVDEIDNAVDKAYSGAPDRLCVVDIDGKVAYHSKRGPWGFKPKDAEKALKEILANNGKVKLPPESKKGK